MASAVAVPALLLGAGQGLGVAASDHSRAAAPKAAHTAAKPKTTTLHLTAIDGIKFNRTKLSARAGRVTIIMRNASTLSHNIALKGRGLKKSIAGKVVPKGGTSRISAILKKGSYTFYCSVPGHEQAGMKGTLTVK